MVANTSVNVGDECTVLRDAMRIGIPRYLVGSIIKIVCVGPNEVHFVDKYEDTWWCRPNMLEPRNGPW